MPGKFLRKAHISFIIVFIFSAILSFISFISFLLVQDPFLIYTVLFGLLNITILKVLFSIVSLAFIISSVYLIFNYFKNKKPRKTEKKLTFLKDLSFEEDSSFEDENIDLANKETKKVTKKANESIINGNQDPNSHQTEILKSSKDLKEDDQASQSEEYSINRPLSQLSPYCSAVLICLEEAKKHIETLQKTYQNNSKLDTLKEYIANIRSRLPYTDKSIQNLYEETQPILTENLQTCVNELEKLTHLKELGELDEHIKKWHEFHRQFSDVITNSTTIPNQKNNLDLNNKNLNPKNQV